MSANNKELESIPATIVPYFAFSDEGSPDLYMREVPGAQGSARERFLLLLSSIREPILAAHQAGCDLLIERRGPRMEWWD